MTLTDLKISMRCRERIFLLDRKKFSDQESMCKAIVTSVVALLQEEFTLGKQFHLALTGGQVGGIVSKHLAERINEDPSSFKGLHIWWSDERFVAQENNERNSQAFLDALAAQGFIHIHESAAADFNIDVDSSARSYAADLFDVDMGLTLLSIGADGHIASLFPSLWSQEETTSAIAIHEAPKPPAQRVSFSMNKINASARVWLLASGAEKRMIIERVIAEDPLLPATFARGRDETLLFTDQELE